MLMRIAPLYPPNTFAGLCRCSYTPMQQTHQQPCNDVYDTYVCVRVYGCVVVCLCVHPYHVPSCKSCKAPHPTLMQALGNACFELDPDKRPTFKQCVEQLTAMLAMATAPSPAQGGAEGLAARNQTRPAISGSDVPDVLTCCNQTPVRTEATLADASPTTAVAA